MAAPRILFFADAGPEVGGGHVMRCLTLARQLAERGAESAFVETRAAAPILRRFGWPEQTPPAISSIADPVAAAQDVADRFHPHLVVMDHYRVGHGAETALRGGRRFIAVLDDLANRRHDCDLIVDPGFGRQREDYRSLVGENCIPLVGPQNALVRPEFAAARSRALMRRARHGPVRRALVSFGLTDVGGITGRAVQALLPRLGDIRLDVVLGEATPSLAVMRGLMSVDRRVHVHVNTQDMVTLTADADIAIGAGGSSVWERACLGLPTATAVLADNQADMAARMAEAGVTLALDARSPAFEAELLGVWDQLGGDAELRWRLSQRSSELCDGRGAERVADAMLSLVRLG